MTEDWTQKTDAKLREIAASIAPLALANPGGYYDRMLGEVETELATRGAR